MAAAWITASLVTMLLCSVILKTLALPSQLPEISETNTCCGYQACRAVKEGMINVHIVPYSYNDNGWLKTVSSVSYKGYQALSNPQHLEERNLQFASPVPMPHFYARIKVWGHRRPTPITEKDWYFNPEDVNVNLVLDSAIDSLLVNPERRFVYAETALFWRWWEEQSASRRSQVRNLVNQGRLEFIGGGWSMNDEAVTHYQSIIDQMTWGLRWLNDTFGECGRPRAGWQTESFGHSREMASILAQMGYDGLFFGRLHYLEKFNRMDAKQAEFVWTTSSRSDTNSGLFTHILDDNQQIQDDCLDVSCKNQETNDTNRMKERVDGLVNLVEQKSLNYKTKNLLFTLGADFYNWDAEDWFSNIDSLIRYTNALQGSHHINVLYSTPTCYLKAVNDLKISWPTKHDDFFPYASEPHVYWTGFYTTRPNFKYFERLGNNVLQVCKQLYALTNLYLEHKDEMNSLQDVMGILQNSDAITGTAKQKKVDSYVLQLTQSLGKCLKVSNAAINKLVVMKNDNPIPKWENCLQLNVSACPPSEESKNFVVTVYNPLAWYISPYIRFPVTGNAYKVLDRKGNSLPNQLISIPQPVRKLPERFSDALNELVFRATDLKPLSFQSYFISQVKLQNNTFLSEEIRGSQDFGHKNYYYNTNKQGTLKALHTRGIKIQVSQRYGYYSTPKHQTHPFYIETGAYILQPKFMKPKMEFKKLNIKTFKGPLLSERHISLNNWLSRVERIYEDELHTEIEWMVGPVPNLDRVGKDVIVKYITNISSQGKFYTDTNGRQLIKRIRDAHTTQHDETGDRIAGNYYPVTNRILLQDDESGLELCILTDRAQGGTSLEDGELELMLYRQLINNHAERGSVTRGKHHLIVGSSGKALTSYTQKLAQEQVLAPLLFFSRADHFTFETWSNTFRMEFQGMKKPFPENVHLLTLEPWKENKLLLRLEHFFKNGLDPRMNEPLTINIRDLFLPFEIITARETTLGANKWKSDSTRFQWKTKSKSKTLHQITCINLNDTLIVTLHPLQICTFIIEVKYH